MRPSRIAINSFPPCFPALFFSHAPISKCFSRGFALPIQSTIGSLPRGLWVLKRRHMPSVLWCLFSLWGVRLRADVLGLLRTEIEKEATRLHPASFKGWRCPALKQGSSKPLEVRAIRARDTSVEVNWLAGLGLRGGDAQPQSDVLPGWQPWPHCLCRGLVVVQTAGSSVWHMLGQTLGGAFCWPSARPTR